MLDRTPKEKRPTGLALKLNLGAYVGRTGLAHDRVTNGFHRK